MSKDELVLQLIYLEEAAGTDGNEAVASLLSKAIDYLKTPFVLMDENMALAMCAGARAIETNKRFCGATYVFDVFGSEKKISYHEAAKILRENAENALGEEVENAPTD